MRNCPECNRRRTSRSRWRANELTIAAQRSSDKHDAQHSEFSYGSFVRTVRLPGGADAGKAKAKYRAGVLEVSVPIKQDKKEDRQFHVAVSE